MTQLWQTWDREMMTCVLPCIGHPLVVRPDVQQNVHNVVGMHAPGGTQVLPDSLTDAIAQASESTVTAMQAGSNKIVVRYSVSPWMMYEHASYCQPPHVASRHSKIQALNRVTGRGAAGRVLGLFQWRCVCRGGRPGAVLEADAPLCRESGGNVRGRHASPGGELLVAEAESTQRQAYAGQSRTFRHVDSQLVCAVVPRHGCGRDAEEPVGRPRLCSWQPQRPHTLPGGGRHHHLCSTRPARLVVSF
jgi:hypothetical protein